MIVFVDGIDGSGKTILIEHLRRSLPERGYRVRVAAPLWRFLPDVSSPEVFSVWVTATDGTTVARALLDAMGRRLEHLRVQIDADSHITFVDRGPKTLSASAWAHAAVSSWPSQAATDEYDRLCRALDSLVSALPCRSVELLVGPDAHPAVIRRLEASETLTSRYRSYLHAFWQAMMTVSDFDLPTLGLSALDSVEVNCRRVVTSLPAGTKSAPRTD